MFVCPECGASHAVAAACPSDGTAMLPRGDDLLLGTQVGVYRIARLLGIGGMGRVYKGVHPQIGSRVAIKVLSRECSDRRDLVDRFFSEAKAVNLIRHESIVNVLDLATLSDGRPYIVMEYLDGAPLSAILEDAAHARQQLPLGGIARLVAEVLDALGAAHAKGIVHRDLKPDNIFVTPAGRPKVLDFGIAKLQPELGGSATHTGSLLGTPHYMSPEQASGRPVDARADLYAVGVILFECATLQKPFMADSLFDLLRQHVEAPPPSARALRRDMPEGMEHVIFAAMAKAPDQRFNSAHAMSMALQHATSQLSADQWAPIQPGRTPTGGGWTPTPPASWARIVTNAPTAPMTPTATAGQVTKLEKKSKKGLWVGLGALALVGGGVTAGVLVAGGGAASGTGSAGRAGSGDTREAKNELPPGPTPTPAPTPEPQPAPTDNTDDDGDLSADQAAQLDEVLNDLPAEAQAAWPPEVRAAIKKYGGWSKIPKAERQKLLGKVVGIVGATDDIGNQINAALAGGGSTPSPKKPAGPTGWFTRHDVTLAGFDPKHASIEKLIQQGYAEAHEYVPDAQVWWIDAANVYADGHADLTLPGFASSTGQVTLRFISPSHGKDDPSVPRGVPQEHHCAFYVLIEPGEATMYETPSQNCKETLLRPPKCTAAQVWKRVLAKHPDAAGAVAQLVYRDNDGSPVWFFEIRDDEKPVSERIPDDC